LSPDELLTQLNNQEQEVQTEAFENFRSKIGSSLGGGSALERRYAMLINNLNKHVWELEKDLQNTKTENVKSYEGMLTGLKRIDPTIKPTPGFFQKLGYGVGRGVGMASKIAGIGLIGSTLSSVGLPAAAVGGILGGGLSALKNSQNTKMATGEKLKKALIAAGIVAATGYAMSKLKEVYNFIPRTATPEEVAKYSQGPPDVNKYVQGPPDPHQQLVNQANEFDIQATKAIDQVNANSTYHPRKVVTFFKDPTNVKVVIQTYLRDNNIEFDNVKIKGDRVVLTTPTGVKGINLDNLKREVIRSQTSDEPSKLAQYIYNKFNP
jgi:hypothetical protein